MRGTIVHIAGSMGRSCLKLNIRFSLLLVVGVMATAAHAQVPYPNPINHVIVIDQENRSVDNLFGSNSPNNQFYLPGLDVSTTGQAYTIVKKKKNVFSVQSISIPLASDLGKGDSSAEYDYDIGHDHLVWQIECDAPSKIDPSNMCAMDGFNRVKPKCDTGTAASGCPGTAYPAYSYVQYQDVAPYFQIASQYGYANYFFQTNQGSSFPAHQFIIGGTSQAGNGLEPAWFAAEEQGGAGSGCLSAATASVAVVNPLTQDLKTKTFPCFDHDTIVDVFAAATIPVTWTYYTPGGSNPWTAPNAIQGICNPVGKNCEGPYWTKGASNGFVDPNPADVLRDIGNCNLNQVDWVIPTGLESDHAAYTDGSGPSWVSSIINAVGYSPCTDLVNGQPLTYWQDTVILVTWDDWGGWYDHVHPPPLPAAAPAIASSYAYGFRVPLLVVSAYTPAGTVDNNTAGLDFGTILKFIEEVFNLSNINSGDLGSFADQWSNGDLSDFFQFSQPPNDFQSIQAPFKPDFFLDPKRPMDPPDDD
jgi:phospholipase C